jgi:hypothetical protein
MPLKCFLFKRRRWTIGNNTDLLEKPLTSPPIRAVRAGRILRLQAVVVTRDRTLEIPLRILNTTHEDIPLAIA